MTVITLIAVLIAGDIMFAVSNEEVGRRDPIDPKFIEQPEGVETAGRRDPVDPKHFAGRRDPIEPRSVEFFAGRRDPIEPRAIDFLI